jgi:toxin ParE1/3/4
VPQIIISTEARDDLSAIRDYIRDELQSPESARRIMASLKKSILSLSHFPERGTPLNSILSVNTPFRFLVCGRYRIFYLIHGKRIEVVRILHTRQDFIRTLF